MRVRSSHRARRDGPEVAQDVLGVRAGARARRACAASSRFDDVPVQVEERQRLEPVGDARRANSPRSDAFVIGRPPRPAITV